MGTRQWRLKWFIRRLKIKTIKMKNSGLSIQPPKRQNTKLHENVISFWCILVSWCLSGKKIRFNRIFVLALTALLPAISYSQNSVENNITDTKKLNSEIALFSRNTTSITANFTQVKEMSFMEEKVTSSGKFYFRNDNNVRWEYTEPFRYAIIVSGERIRIIDEGEQKDIDAGSSRMFREVSQVMTGMVNGTLLTDGRFAVSWLEEGDYYRAELVPVSGAMKDYLSAIELKLNKTDYSAEELKMVEKSGDYTIITFKNKKINATIPPEIFRLD